MPRQPFFRLSLLLLVAAGSILSACRKPETRVQTATSEIRDIFSRVSESGVIQPTIEVPVAPDVSGEVVFIAIKEGDKVKKGDLLLTIRPDDYRAQLEQADAALSRSKAAYLQAQASVVQAEATLLQDSVSMERTRELFRDQVVSQLDLENAELRYKVSRSQWEAAKYNVQSAYYQVESAEATRKQSRQNLDRTNIYASMDGTITLLNVEVGQRVVGTSMMSGTEILKIADLSSMEVVVEVNENDIINVSLNDSARVEVDAFPGEIFYGAVTEIAYSAQVAGLSVTDQVTNFEVKVKVAPASYAGIQTGKNRPAGESPFRPGMTALVEIFTRQETGAVAVPIQAVTLRTQEGTEEAQEVIFRLDGSQVVQVPVRTGISDDTHIQVVEGLEADQTIVTGPYTTLSRDLKDGTTVVVDEGRRSRRP